MISRNRRRPLRRPTRSARYRMEVNLNSLTANVGALGVECPWTRRQKTADMLFYLRKELLEVEEELRKPKVDGLRGVGK